MTHHLSLPSIVLLKCAALLCIALAGCSRHNSAPPGYATQTAVAQLAAPMSEANTPQRRADSLAYEHTLAVELPEQSVADRIKEVRSACETRKDFACTVLDVAFRTQLEVPSGQVRMRLAPTAIEPMVEISARGGRIISRNTHAEDLAEPIADTDRQLALLSSHRDRLDEFLQRKDLKVEQVIELSKEVSSSQTQIDALRAQRANLQRRIDTELLTIELSPPIGTEATRQTPLADAVRSFGSDLREAIAQVIRFIAFLLPWLIVIVPGIVLLRLFWRWITRWLARREPGRSGRL